MSNLNQSWNMPISVTVSEMVGNYVGFLLGKVFWGFLSLPFSKTFQFLAIKNITYIFLKQNAICRAMGKYSVFKSIESILENARDHILVL